MQQNSSPQSDSIEVLFGAWLRKVRTESGLSQRGLAAKLAGIGLTLDPTAITRIEKGTRALRLGEAAMLASALDTSIERVLAEIGDPATLLRTRRDRADKAMASAEMNAWEFLWGLQQIKAFLMATPSAMPALPADRYYQWVLDRRNRLNAERTRYDYSGIFETNEKDAQLLREIAATLVSGLVIVGEPPEYGDDDGPDSAMNPEVV